jgi:hypothetical protein
LTEADRCGTVLRLNGPGGSGLELKRLKGVFAITDVRVSGLTRVRGLVAALA